jgi:DtxR family Mn-dependent transcriptional regulator
VDTLLDLAHGEAGRVADISPACQGSRRRRLLDLGVVPGTEIVPELVSVGGDPVAYRIRGALVALRRGQAEWIRIERVRAGASEPVGAASR